MKFLFSSLMELSAKLQNDTETIFDSKKTFRFSPTFAGFFTGLPPALLPVEAFYLPIRSLALAIVPTLEVRSFVSNFISP